MRFAEAKVTLDSKDYQKETFSMQSIDNFDIIGLMIAAFSLIRIAVG